uniref:hypothetical protein n=1 Tax=Thaumasiovibrio occultus TaxID=1891184 RepID=UPI000B34D98E|nr:hypothetical protein [Thaumasiovibrio occultus]
MKSLLFLGLLTLVGCTNQIDGYYTPVNMDVVTVRYQFEAKPANQSLSQHTQAVYAFVEDNRDMLLKEQVTLYWSGNTGKQLAIATHKRLLAIGVPPHQIKVTSRAANVPLQILVDTHHVQVPICEPYVAEEIERGAFNCYTESARWSSMVHPEKMLSGTE